MPITRCFPFCFSFERRKMAMSYNKTLDNIFKKAFGSQYKTKYTKPRQQQVHQKPVIQQKNPPIVEKHTAVQQEVEKPVEQKSIKEKVTKQYDIPKYDKLFLDTFKKFTPKYRDWDVWRDFIILSACTISNSVDKGHYRVREDLYLDTIKKYDKERQMLFPELFAHTVMALELNPEQDFLGHIFMNLQLGSKSNGQFFTPYHICELMANMTMSECEKEIKEKGYISVHDSCCGAGATLIAAINCAKHALENTDINYQQHILVTGQDIDMVVGLMCYIQISLLGVAGFIKIGNALTEPMSTGDDKGSYWYTPMSYTGKWFLRIFLQNL